MPIRITGMNSGLDTEALVSELVSAYRKKSEKYTKAQTKLSWKQDAWKELNTKINKFYGSVRSLKYSSAYNSKKASVLNSTKATVTAKNTVANGIYELKINQVAKSGYLTGAKLNNNITENSTMSELGYTGTDGRISVTSGGKTTDITVTGQTKVSDFLKSLNDAGVNASFDSTNHRIFLSAKKSGKENDFTITGTNLNGNNALSKLGLSVDSQAEMNIYKEYAKYAKNTDGGNYFEIDPATGEIKIDADGKAITNGQYSPSETQKNIEDIKQLLSDSSAIITRSNVQINYAKSYKIIHDVDQQNPALTDDEKTLLKELGAKSDLSNVYVGVDNTIYEKQSDGTYVKKAADGSAVTVTQDELDSQGGATAGSTVLSQLEGKAGLTAAGLTGADYAAAQATIESYKDMRVEYNLDDIEADYDAGILDVDQYVADRTADMNLAQANINQNKLIMEDSSSAAVFTTKVYNAASILDGTTKVDASNGAKRIYGQDTEIELNGTVFTGTSNEITVNGLTINAMSTTKDDETISISVTNDSQGMYDKIKGFIKEYNEIINELTKMYNADSAKGYEPLTSDEKEAMTDKEIEEWEKKIKGSILRRDDSLNQIMTVMKNAMFKTYTVNGKNYSLSSFGISTLGVLNATKNEENAFHIDGNSEDTEVSGKTDKLLSALQEDPDTVADFMIQLATGLYDAIGDKMSSSTLSSFGVVYNDKEMAREYSDYTKTISKWEEKLKDIEDSYYKKFAAMESALAALQSQQSSLANLFA